MDVLIVRLLILCIDVYIVLLFIRLFVAPSECYDAAMGLVFKGTDPVVVPVATTLGIRHPAVVPLLLIGGLVLLKGVITGSMPRAVQGFTDTLLQLYVLMIILTAVLQEYYINPITNFGQRIVLPIRALATTVSRQPLAMNITAAAGLVVVHALVTFILRTITPLSLLVAFVHSVGLIVNLTEFFVLVLIVNAVMSWFSPDPLNPLVQLVRMISGPILTPIRRLIPPVGGVLDISPIIAIFGFYMLKSFGYNLLKLLQG